MPYVERPVGGDGCAHFTDAGASSGTILTIAHSTQFSAMIQVAEAFKNDVHVKANVDVVC